jgi:serine protease AprX
MRAARHRTLPALFLIFVLVGQGRAQETKKEIQDKQNPARFHPDIKILSSVKEYEDVRWCDLTKITAPLTFDLISTLWFNRETGFGTAKYTAQAILEKAKNPGLGVRSIHKRGITGRGVNVAIIDQNLCLNHPEFKGKVVLYKDVGCEQPPGRGSMHAPGVMSLLAGNTIGTAPDVRVYFAAAPSWTADAKFQAEALDWILEVNRSLPKGAKIKVVSISAAPSGKGSPFKKNNGLWDRTVKAAKKAGILVLDCTVDNGIIGPCFYDINDPDDVGKCRAGFPGRPGSGPKDRVYAPCSARTTAEEYDEGNPSYQYCGRGGLSWSIPYAAGVLALGWQVKPNLTADEIVKLLFETAHLTTDGYKIINPAAFINAAEKF